MWAGESGPVPTRNANAIGVRSQPSRSRPGSRPAPGLSALRDPARRQRHAMRAAQAQAGAPALKVTH
eukprot:4248702-Prymnesium_polylepis.1